MKKEYQMPKVEMISVQDVIATSGDGAPNSGSNPFGG